MTSWHRIIAVPMLNKRKSPRRKMVLPVKISVDKVTHLAHTVDITTTGARLGALRTQLQPGMIVSLQRGSNKAEFRVQWVRQLGRNEVQAGVESLEPQNNFWGINLSDEAAAKKDMQTLLTLLSGRSKSVM
jgi:PilZ domain-containing protein